MGMVRQMTIVAFPSPFNLISSNLMFASASLTCCPNLFLMYVAPHSGKILVTKYAINEMTNVTEWVSCTSGNI